MGFACFDEREFQTGLATPRTLIDARAVENVEPLSTRAVLRGPGRAVTMPDMTEGYDARERRELARALERGEAPRCPVCGELLVSRDVSPNPALSYVRRRVWLICPACKRSASIDLPRRELG